MYKNHLLVSSFFGEAEIDIYDAPKGARCIFFTNNEKIASKSKIAGWEAIILNHGDFELSTDIRVSSMQSKYVKFLQFKYDFPDLDGYQIVTYADHHAKIQEPQILEIFNKNDKRKSILIRSSPRKKSLSDEVRISLRQPRYAASMDETLKWIERVKSEREISDGRQIANTGLIHTTQVDKMMPLFDAVYNASKSLNQPQCQILWVVISEPYASDIHQIGWYDLDIPWGAAVIDRRAKVKD